MNKFIILFVLVLVAISNIHCYRRQLEDHSHKLKIEIVSNIYEYQQANPNVYVYPMHMQSTVSGGINYYLGARVRGDRLVASGSRNNPFPSPQNVGITLKYPPSGTGSVLTYIGVNVTQSTNLGQAYVTSGGIGQRFISFVVEAYNTTYLNFAAKFFGI